MIGRMIERLFVQVRADMTDLSKDLSQGMAQTRQATNSMALSWNQVSSQVDLFTSKLSKGKITQGQYTTEMNRLASTMKNVAGSYQLAQKEVWGYASAAQAASRATNTATNTRPINNFTRSVGMARNQMLNLGYQINDIGVSLAGGMNPLLVMVQQGSQIQQIYGGQGGVKTLFSDLAGILRGLARATWPLAVIASGLGILSREINKTTDVAVSFGDTTKAVFQVIGGYIWQLVEGPVSWLQEKFGRVLDFIAEWFPKVMNKVVGVTVAAVKIIAAVWDELPELVMDTWTMIKNYVLQAVEDIINFVTQDMVPGIMRGLDRVLQSFIFAFNAVKIVWGQLPDLMKDSVGGAVNWVVDGTEKMVNVAIEGINKLIAGLQSLMDFVGADKALELFGFSGDLTPLSEADLSTWKMETGNALGDVSAELGEAAGRIFNTKMLENAVKIDESDLSAYMGDFENVISSMGARIDGILSETMGKDYMGEFFSEVRTQAIENALARIAAGMEDVGDAAGRAAEEVKSMMEKLNDQLVTAADNLAGVFGSAFEQLATTGKLTFGDFVSELNSLIISSTSEILQQELSNMFQSLATSQGGLGSFFSNLFTGLFGGGLPGRARGGVNMPWAPFVAHEEGYERITRDGPAGAYRVTTAGQTRHAMRTAGGGGMSVTMNIQTPDANSFRQSQTQLASRMSRILSQGRRNQ